ncbi:MAG: NAD(P)/FAD-dependent oxidoreductase [Acidimicrobiia bacterium]
MTTTVEVVVVGAGPAGTAAATTLARAGREVLVLDRARFPRDKICGDGLTTGALRRLEHLGLDPTAVPSWRRVDDVVVRGPAGRAVTFGLPRDQGTFAAVAARADLDAALVAVARAAGAEVREGHACRAAAEHLDRVVLDVEGLGEVHARYVVGADGMWSPLRRALGLSSPGYRGEWHAFRQYFAEVGPRAASELFVWFEPDLLPGYAWSFPLAGGRANVGFGILRGSTTVPRVRRMKDLWPEVLARPHVAEVLGTGARPEAPHRAWPIPARVDRTVLTGARTLFVGDAAAACDPLTGEGIGQALATGVLAGEVLATAGARDPAATTAAYRSRVRAALLADHRAAAALGRVLAHPRAASGAVALAGATPWVRRQFARWLFEDYPRALLATPRRWRPGTLGRPGAWAVPPGG